MLHELALQLLERLPDAESPCCVLLDVRIPGLSGPALQNRLAALGFKLPIIFLTGYGDIPTSVQTIKAGAEDFLTKPVPRARLLAAIERATSRHQASRARLERLDAWKQLRGEDGRAILSGSRAPISRNAKREDARRSLELYPTGAARDSDPRA